MDGHLLKALNDRDETALAEIQKKYGNMMHALSRRILGSDEDAAECVNDVLLEIWNTVPPAQPAGLSSYAFMLTRRTAIDKLRAAGAQKRGGAEYRVALEELEECVGAEDEFIRESDSSEIRETIENFLKDQKSTDRRIFLARYFDFLSIDEIALACGLGKNAVNIRLSRMRKKLRASFEERGIYI
ncbi:MAG: sigma-70 family RNA polymerase sigma factor [Clostridia bacterium]|nr:sigma-70 family RNA polymerase sigma factor [Clostridia bacterium]